MTKINLIILATLLLLVTFSPLPLKAEEATLRQDILKYYDAFAKTAHLPVSASLPQETLGQRIVVILSFILGLLGTIFLLLIVYGGFLWMTARGNEEHIKKAQAILRDAVIGLLVIFAAYVITWYVGNYIIESFT